MVNDNAEKDDVAGFTGERWECGPHANAWGGHDARCRRISPEPDADAPASHWTSWPPMDDGPLLTDEEQIALVTAVRVQQVARIISRDTGASEEAATVAAWALASIGLLATPWRGEHLSTRPGEVQS